MNEALNEIKLEIREIIKDNKLKDRKIQNQKHKYIAKDLNLSLQKARIFDSQEKNNIEKKRLKLKIDSNNIINMLLKEQVNLNYRKGLLREKWNSLSRNIKIEIDGNKYPHLVKVLN